MLDGAKRVTEELAYLARDGALYAIGGMIGHVVSANVSENDDVADQALMISAGIGVATLCHFAYRTIKACGSACRSYEDGVDQHSPRHRQ